MPQMARRQYIQSRNYGYPQAYSYVDVPVRTSKKRKTVQNALHKNSKKKRINPIAQLISMIFFGCVGFFVIPTAFHDISLPLFTGKQNYSHIKADYYKILFPTTNYLSNNILNNKRAVVPVESKKPLMTSLYRTERLTILEKSLNELMEKYPTIHPAITVWDFNTGKYADINGSEIFSAASIIKVPVLISLFKSIEANRLSIYDEMYLTNYYKASGSGKLQYQPVGNKYTIDQLAKVMIQDSDNSATNMIMSKLGSMTSVNSDIRNWGMKNTHIQTWLPDLRGTNYTTTNDMATMLFNLDNPTFLSINSREYIVDYMSHVKNDRLIPQGLGKGATFLHKTGDIGTMLGDAGIVFMPDGRKYIVVIMANRPFNSPLGKNFIQQASKVIYTYMSTLY
ncbi:serine hydrolase [bacterium]|nr:serine hydrolase [bacterium]